MSDPIHTHDCDHCTYLGTARGKDIWLHWNTDTGQAQLLLRSGSDGPDYVVWTVDQVRRQFTDGIWLYALGLYDGYERRIQDHAAESIARRKGDRA